MPNIFIHTANIKVPKRRALLFAGKLLSTKSTKVKYNFFSFFQNGQNGKSNTQHHDTDFGAGSTETEPALLTKFLGYLCALELTTDKCYKLCNFKLQLESDTLLDIMAQIAMFYDTS